MKTLDELEKDRQRLIRSRRWLIGTGIPLAVLALGWAFFLNPFVAICAFAGSFVAMRTYDLIVTHEPTLDDGPLNR